MKRRKHCVRECIASERFTHCRNEETYAGGKAQVGEEQQCTGDVSNAPR